MKTISREEAARIIMETQGKVFTAQFVKKDKTERTMNARLNVTKHLKGGVSTIKDKEHLIGCYDMANGGYRCINVNTLKRLKANGKEYTVV